MRMRQEFSVARDVATVWEFFSRPESVARCMPGVEQIRVLDEENLQVRATQSLGPMTATFDTRVTILERDPGRMIRFRAAGRSVRGAIGNLRTDNTVLLSAVPGGTAVAVDSDLVLAGALGSVGQKVISRQAGKVTAEFAANLQRALGGEVPGVAAGLASEVPARAAATATGPAPEPGPAGGPAPERPDGPDRWSMAAAVLSGVSAAVSVYVLVRELRRSR